MSKIFKSKKPQGMENGTKATGTANQKSKVYATSLTDIVCIYDIIKKIIFGEFA